uniref:Lipoxygenase domain-containing protein n=1 Tax=Pipistrellus kuhlii TaxID=59472 RepID=A0A7J7TX21_PIPKU|nr:hypothetical protein mPipKuh1_000602 [Pipistrellus kuhlii]
MVTIFRLTPQRRFAQRWQEDELFGYQFLNGSQPHAAETAPPLCPSRLVLPSEMEELQAQLEKELQNGSLFEADFILLDGILGNVIQGEKQYLAVPLVMLKMEPSGKLLPMVIQIQPPSPSCPTPPLFLPSDPPLVWLLVKMWVRSSDSQLHELQYHLLSTHLLGEVIAVATMRCLPGLHPVFKLLIPHTRYTLDINTRARNQLVSEGGLFDKVLHQAMAKLTYRSLCPPDDLADWGLLGIPSALYAHDAFQLWEITARYVEGIIHLFYHGDDVVRGDPELQAWCQEITEVGLCQAQDRGFPVSFQSRAQLCHFFTMCIFTCSAQHAAVNMGQFDWYAWVPNAPSSMRMAPTTTKKDVTMDTVMGSLPNVWQTSLQMLATWLVSRSSLDMVPLGHHKEEYFSGPEPKAILRQFQADLDNLEREIEAQNEQLDLPYEYLKPSLVESKKVHQRWQHDELFGYQFLNGANPMLLRRSTSLPSRLVLPSEMEELQAQLEKELQKVSLFEADFILLDGIAANEKQYLAVPVVILKMEPMVIQIQPPSPSCPTPPLFLPSDPPLAWLLAKMWVRSSDSQLHELQYHLLSTHLLGEVIAVATMRCLPGLHPVFKVHPLPSLSHLPHIPEEGNNTTILQDLKSISHLFGKKLTKLLLIE